MTPSCVGGEGGSDDGEKNEPTTGLAGAVAGCWYDDARLNGGVDRYERYDLVDGVSLSHPWAERGTRGRWYAGNGERGESKALSQKSSGRSKSDSRENELSMVRAGAA